MSRLLSSRVDHHITRLGIFLLAAALVLGVTNCAPIQHTLSVRSTLGGSVAVPGEGDYFYGTGEVVELEAEAEQGYRFVNWTGDMDTIADVEAASTTITMNGDYVIIANFEEAHELTVSSTEGGLVTTPGEGVFTYQAGAVVSLVVSPASGHRFVNWTGDVDTIADVEAASTTITLDGDYEITASFVAQYVLTIGSTEGGEVINPGQGTFTYDAGTVVDLVTESDEGYKFMEWTGDVDYVTDVNAASTTVTMNGGYTIAAGFAKEIRTWHDLHAIRDNLSGHYVLVNDLDSTTAGYAELASPTANHESGWRPIVVFSGRFYGQGYEIRELFISLSAKSGVGLFGQVSGGGAIDSLGVVNMEVTGHDAVGGLVGDLAWGTVSNSYSEGSATGNVSVGGLVGLNRGTVNKSHSMGSVTGGENAGGLVGVNYGTVSDCHSTSRVTGSANIGGLVGWNPGTVSNCYSTGAVSGSGRIGGLVGANYRGSVNECYSSGSATGDREVGGLVGWNQESTVSNSYAIGSVTGGSDVGGLIGHNQSYATVTNSYYSYDEVAINGKSMITCGALFGEDFKQWLANDRFLDVNERLSEEDGYYLIDDVSDLKQLLAFGQNSLLRFRLTNDPDLAAEPGFYVPYLAGVFDGNGHKIQNLSVALGSVSNVGLFGYLTPSGVLREVAAENVSIIANYCVGGLVGWNQGMVTRSSAIGTVAGRGWVGGLAGSSAGGTLTDCHFAGSVAGDSDVGGLAGQHMAGSVRNSHYSVDEVLLNGRRAITIGALFSQDFDQWLGSDMRLDINERLSREGGYYIINDVSDFKQLLAFGQNSALKFRLEGDLDLEAEPGFYIPYLAGEFDGGGHTISNLSLDLGFASRLGLFGYLASSGKVSRVGVQNVSIVGGPGVGGLVGWNAGVVSESYSTGSVTGTGDVGGLVGFSGGTVMECYSESTVTGQSSVGGLLGRNWDGTVVDSYATGSATGHRAVGGLVAWNKGAIRRSYSTGRVSGVDHVGGLVGTGDADWWGSGWAVQSFWDIESSGSEQSDAGTGKTTAEMKDIATFVRWDIVAVAVGEANTAYTWNIVDGETYPFLSWETA